MHKRTPEGMIAVLIAYFGEKHALATTWKWLVNNHKTDDSLKWLDFKLYRGIQKRGAASLSDASTQLRSLRIQLDVTEMQRAKYIEQVQHAIVDADTVAAESALKLLPEKDSEHSLQNIRDLRTDQANEIEAMEASQDAIASEDEEQLSAAIDRATTSHIPANDIALARTKRR